MENRPETVGNRPGSDAAGVVAPDTGDSGAAEKTERSGPAVWWRAYRDRIARRPALDLCYRIGVAVVGTVVFVVGVVTIPFPGPGWALVFTGIGILATEFAVARHALTWLRDKYRRGMAWYISRGPLMQILAFLATCAVVVATLWIIGTFGLAGDLIGVDWPWLRSPLIS
ncbi:TIGR02611 family protein [Nocardia sp. X0981]